jgi:hypothetical protein
MDKLGGVVGGGEGGVACNALVNRLYMGVVGREVTPLTRCEEGS